MVPGGGDAGRLSVGRDATDTSPRRAISSQLQRNLRHRDMNGLLDPLPRRADWPRPLPG